MIEARGRQSANRQPQSTIFRADALRLYAQRRQQPALPRFTSPGGFALLWILSALLLSGVFAAWFARVPVYASGKAALVRAESGNREGDKREGDAILVVAFLPPDTLPRLKVGQIMFVQVRERGVGLRLPVASVEPDVSSPEAARNRFALNSSASGALTRPSAVALARMEDAALGLPASVYAGSVCRVDVEVGSRRVISLLPGMGHLFAE